MSGLKLVRHQAEQDKLIEARVKKAGDTMTGNLTMSGAAKVVGNLQGNSDTATRLQNARNISINGVARSFNGTGNISWSLAEIGAAATNHNQTSNSITAMTGYTKPATGGAIATTDSLNTAIGKLEKSLESKANSNHTHNYLPLSGGTISGDILCNVNDKLQAFDNTQAVLTVSRKEIEYVQAKRLHGKTSNNFFKLYDAAMLGFTSYTKIGMHVATILGFIIATLCILIGIVYLIFKLIYWDKLPTGIAPILISMFFIGGVQLFFIGFLGEYIVNINARVMNRPLVVEEERVNF